MNAMEKILLPSRPEYEPWFGGCYEMGVPKDAHVCVLPGKGSIIHLAAVGDITTVAQHKLTLLIDFWSRKSAVKIIVLNFTSWAGEARGIFPLAIAIAEARQRVRVVAHLRCGCGSAYHIASFCNEVWATPHDPIGLFSYGLTDMSLLESVASALGRANKTVLDSLMESRPQVDRDAAIRLFFETETGEAAELHGLVDNLKTTFLTAIDLATTEEI